MFDFLKKPTANTQNTGLSLSASTSNSLNIPKTSQTSTSPFISKPQVQSPTDKLFASVGQGKVENNKFVVSSPTTPAIQNKVLSTPTTVSSLTNAPTYTPPINTQPTISSNTAPIVDKVDTAAATTTKPTGRESALERILALNEQQATQADRQRIIEEENQLAAKQDKLNTLNARAMSVDRDYENKRRALLENPEGKLASGLQGEIRNLERVRDQQLADIGIQQAVAQGDVKLAETRIKQKVDSEFEPIKNQIAGLEKYLTLYSDDLTASEKIMLEKSLAMQVDAAKKGYESSVLEQSALSYQELLNSGQIKIADVPKDVMPYLNTGGYVSPEQKEAKNQAVSLLTGFDSFRNLGGTGAVGAPVSRILPWLGSFVGVGNFNADKALIKNIKASLTLGNLSMLKGAMSDKDLQFITEASSALNENMSESQFKKELLNIQSKVVNGIVKSPAFSQEEKEAQVIKLMDLQAPKATDEEIAEMARRYLQSFNTAGNATASTLRNAVVAQESGGSYTIVNKDSGALGKYQIMPSNLKNLVGLADTPENRRKFLSSPQLQDKAFDNLISELNTTYKGDMRKVLAAYYGGGKAAQIVGTPAGDRPQGKYPSINQYVSQVISKINNA